MSLAPRLDLRQSQSLVMTPQLQQAIKLLTLSNLEIEAFIGDALEANPPPAPGGKRIKLRYITQAGTRPPRFVVFGTRLDMLPTSYERYLVNGIRRELGFDAVPVRVVLKTSKNPYASES